MMNLLYKNRAADEWLPIDVNSWTLKKSIDVGRARTISLKTPLDFIKPGAFVQSDDGEYLGFVSKKSGKPGKITYQITDLSNILKLRKISYMSYSSVYGVIDQTVSMIAGHDRLSDSYSRYPPLMWAMNSALPRGIGRWYNGHRLQRIPNFGGTTGDFCVGSKALSLSSDLSSLASGQYYRDRSGIWAYYPYYGLYFISSIEDAFDSMVRLGDVENDAELEDAMTFTNVTYYSAITSLFKQYGMVIIPRVEEGYVYLDGIVPTPPHRARPVPGVVIAESDIKSIDADGEGIEPNILIAKNADGEIVSWHGETIIKKRGNLFYEYIIDSEDSNPFGEYGNIKIELRPGATGAPKHPSKWGLRTKSLTGLCKYDDNVYVVDYDTGFIQDVANWDLLLATRFRNVNKLWVDQYGVIVGEHSEDTIKIFSSSGDLIGSIETQASISAPPVMATADYIFVGNGNTKGKVAEYDRSTLALITESDLIATEIVNMSFDGTHIFVSSFYTSAFLILKLDTSLSTDSYIAMDYVIPDLCTDGAHVYGVSGSQFKILKLDMALSAIEESITVKEQLNYIEYYNGRLYATGAGGEIYIYDLRGDLLEAIPAPSSSPQLDPGTWAEIQHSGQSLISQIQETEEDESGNKTISFSRSSSLEYQFLKGAGRFSGLETDDPTDDEEEVISTTLEIIFYYDNYLYCADSTNSWVLKYNLSSGIWSVVIDMSSVMILDGGPWPADFMDLWVDGSNIYVSLADSPYFTVFIYDHDGNYVDRIDTDHLYPYVSADSTYLFISGYPDLGEVGKYIRSSLAYVTKSSTPLMGTGAQCLYSSYIYISGIMIGPPTYYYIYKLTLSLSTSAYLQTTIGVGQLCTDGSYIYGISNNGIAKIPVSLASQSYLSIDEELDDITYGGGYLYGIDDAGDTIYIYDTSGNLIDTIDGPEF
jgi:hypothetical protein